MKKTSIYALALVMLWCNNAYANMAGEYYTFNGFGPITSAFRFIALIFGDNGYITLFFSITVAGILFGGIATYYKLLTGGKGGSPLAWVWPVGLGVIIYIALFIPKGQITVYDKVLNRFDTIGGIPDGLVVVATVLNKIESGIVQIIQDSGQPLSYYDSAGGVGFTAFMAISDPLSGMGKQSKVSNATNYINDCVFSEMATPGTTLTYDALSTTDQPIMDLFAQAQNNAIETSRTDDDGTVENNITCADAYPALQNDWSTTTTDPMLRGKCASIGFDVTNAAEYQRCQDIIGQTLTVVMGNGGVNANQFLQQTAMANILRSSTVGGNLDGGIVQQADVNMKTSMISAGLVANEYLPVMRAVITAIAIGMVPFVVIFLPTPLGTKSIGFVAGFFVWLAAWGITDAITHQMAIDYSNSYFNMARQNNIGYAAMMAIPDAASRTLGMFGMVRTAGVMLATLITTTLMKFGGALMGQMAGHFQGDIQGAASKASGIATSEGAAQKVAQYEGSVATMANAGRYSFQESSAAQEFSGAQKTQTSLEQSDRLSGGKGPSAAGIMGDHSGRASGMKGAAGVIETNQSADALDGPQGYVDNVSRAKANEAVASVQGANQTADEMGGGKTGDHQFQKQMSNAKKIDNETKAGTAEQSRDVAEALFAGTTLEPGKGQEGLGQNALKQKSLAALQGGGKIKKEMVPALEKALHMESGTGSWLEGFSLAKGKDALSSDDRGNLMVKGDLIKNEGNKSTRVSSDGMVMETGTMNKSQIREKADALVAQGHPEAAAGMFALLSKKDGGTAAPGSGMLDNERFQYKETRGLDGSHAFFEGKHGATIAWKDTTTRDQFQKTDNVSGTKSGTDNERMDINTKKEDHGLTLGHGLQQVMERDKGFASPLTNAKNEGERRSAIAAMSQSVGSDMANFYSRAGISADSASASAKMSAHAGFDVPFVAGAELAGQAGIEGRRTDQNQTNLLNRDMAVTIDKADKEATASHLTGDKHSQYVMDKLHDHVEGLTRKVMENNPDKFGASAPGAAMNEMINKVKGGAEPDSSGHPKDDKLKSFSSPSSEYGTSAPHESGHSMVVALNESGRDDKGKTSDEKQKHPSSEKAEAAADQLGGKSGQAVDAIKTYKQKFDEQTKGLEGANHGSQPVMLALNDHGQENDNDKTKSENHPRQARPEDLIKVGVSDNSLAGAAARAIRENQQKMQEQIRDLEG